MRSAETAATAATANAMTRLRFPLRIERNDRDSILSGIAQEQNSASVGDKIAEGRRGMSPHPH